MSSASSGAVPGQPIAELLPAHAPPEIARIYAAISRLSGVTLPALIWRHLATLPGALPAVWSAIAPLYEQGILQETAWRATHQSLAGKAAQLSRAQLLQAGCPSAAIDAYRLVLESYNRTNPVNFLTVKLISQALATPPATPLAIPLATPPPAEARPAARPSGGWTPPSPIVGLPPMVEPSAIPPETRRLIDDLAVDPAIDRARVVPSLYRHLVAWPPLVASIHAAVMPHIRSGAYQALQRQLAANVAAEAASLRPHLHPLPAFAGTEGLGAVLDSFSGLIPEMIVIGGLLRNGLDAP